MSNYIAKDLIEEVVKHMTVEDALDRRYEGVSDIVKIHQDLEDIKIECLKKRIEGYFYMKLYERFPIMLEENVEVNVRCSIDTFKINTSKLRVFVKGQRMTYI